MSRVTRLILILLLLVFFLEFSSSTSAQTPTTIRILVGIGRNTSEKQAAALEEIAEDYNSEHDTIHIVFDIEEQDSALSSLKDQIAAGDPPDIVGPINIRNLQYLNDIWADLTPFIEADQYDLDTFYEPSVQLLQVGGRQIGLPQGLYPSMILYNMDLFDEARLDYPPHEFGAEGWTFEALRQLALELTLDSNGFTPLEPEFDDEDILQWGYDDSWASIRELVAGWGADYAVVSSDGHTMALNDPIWEAALTWYRDGMNEHFIPREEELDEIYAADAGSPPETGQIAMFYVHTWFLFSDAEYLDFNWDIAAVPSTPNGTTTARLQANVFAVTDASTHKDEAWQVLTWLLAPEQQSRFGVAGGLYTCVPSAVSLQDETSAVILEMFPNIDTQVIFDSIAYGDVPSHESWLPDMPAIEDLLADTSAQLLAGELSDTDIHDYLDTLNEQAQAIADEYWAEVGD